MSNYNKNDLNQTKCEFKFTMNNPKTGQNFVDLKDILTNPSTYQNWVQMDSCNKYSAFQVTRNCVENNSNKFYSGRENSEVNLFYLFQCQRLFSTNPDLHKPQKFFERPTHLIMNSIRYCNNSLV